MIICFITKTPSNIFLPITKTKQMLLEGLLSIKDNCFSMKY